MSKELTNSEFGKFSLLTSLITIFIFVLGFDFYNFSIRDILRTKNELDLRIKIFSKFVFFVVIYIIFFLLGLVVFNYLSYTKDYVYYVILLCITEHISQEFYRLLIGFGKILLANILLFLRTMGWSLVVFYMIMDKIAFAISDVLKLWLMANSLTILYLIIVIIKNEKNNIIKLKVNFGWIKYGIKVCYIFLISTIFLKITEYSNRFIVNYYLGEEMAGIFTFYSSISILITVYINTIVISFELPELIKTSKHPYLLKKLFIKFKKSLIVQVSLVSLVLFVIIKPILYWQNREEFQMFLPLLIYMVLGVSLMNYSLLYHYKLYVKHKDKILLKIMIISGIISLILSSIFTKYFGIYGAGIAFTLSGVLFYYLRLYECRKIDL